MKFLRRYPRDHVPLALLAGGLALLCGLGHSSPPAPTLTGVAQALGKATGTQVQPGEFVWEPSRGLLGDLFLGRRVLFLGRPSADSARDVYRAQVRVSPEGRPIEVESVLNLTASPLGDEQGLVGGAQHAAYATVTFGAVQQITLLDLQGQRSQISASLVDWLMTGLTNWQQTGATAGLGRTEISANIKAQAAKLLLDGPWLRVAIDSELPAFDVELQSGALRPEPGGKLLGVSSMQVPQLTKPPVIWAVDTVRAVTGPEPIAWLEEHAFDVKDWTRRASFWAHGGSRDRASTEVARPPVPPQVTKLTVGADGWQEDRSWPPQPLRSIWKEPLEQEGQWQPVRLSFLKKNRITGAKAEPPPYYYETFVRPDPDRPYSKVLLVAMDSRQLQLGMEGGIEDPQSLTGARGEGRIPREPKTLYRAVGAFNGAFKTTHGAYGMMVDRRVLVPPKAGAATVVVLKDGRAGFGSWPQSEAIPQDLLSFRQNLDPLVEDFALNPSRRKQWGWHLHGTRMLTHRSALCLTASGHMIYGWGAEVTGESLGNAMIAAGCSYAIHLDMNPHHTAFVYLDVHGPGSKAFDTKILTPEMEVLPERFIVWSPKDFFYLTLRAMEPPELPGVRWDADPGVQPPPAWSPAAFSAQVVTDGAKVKLWGLAQARASFRLRSGALGAAEPAGQVQAGAMLSAQESKALLGTLIFGGEPHHSRLGMRVGGASQAPIGAEALLWLDGQGQLHLNAPGQPAPANADAIELAALKVEDSPTALARRAGPARERAAVCVSPDGFIWVAQTHAAADAPLVSALSQLGCSLVASLDRGPGPGAHLNRAGGAAVVPDRYEEPALYMFGRTLLPGAFRWKPEAPPTH